MAKLEASDQAPAFALEGNDGRVHSLADARGGALVLYFYPKDDTPGCTIEACDFRDHLSRLTATGAAVLGVSKDSLASHAKFRDKYGLTFPLLSDPDAKVHEAYGAWGEKLFYGKKIVGVIRSTFVIDARGIVTHAWYGVKAKGHVEQVLAALLGDANDAPVARKAAAAKKTTSAKKPAATKKTTSAKKPAAAKKTTSAKKPAAAKKTTSAKKASGR